MRRLNPVRNRKQALRVVKELDAFPKVPESYKETSASGGGLSIVTFIIIIILVISEVRYYASTSLKFDCEVDGQYDQKMQINIDMVVAMRCDLIGADVLDVTGQDARYFGKLNEEDTYFELTNKQRFFFNSKKDVNKYLREEYHAIHELLWLTGNVNLVGEVPHRDVPPVGQPDACRLYGSLHVNKVAGNFHITAGKSVPVIPSGHAHLALLIHESEYNFSHRINHFSFGEPVTGIISPLDGEELITHNNYHMFQYFVKIVPTEVKTYAADVDTFQYAVTERNRSINHSEGSHGVAGIFVKYDLSSLKIRVREVHKPYWMFLVRMCGIIGGIFSVSGMLHGVIGLLVDVVCCRYKVGKYKPKSESPAPVQPQTQSYDLSSSHQLPDLSNIPNVSTAPLPDSTPLTPLLQQQQQPYSDSSIPNSYIPDQGAG